MRVWFKQLEVYFSKKIEENPTKTYYLICGLGIIILVLNAIMISYRNFI